MSAYPVQVEDAMWMVPLYFVLLPDVLEPHADRTTATRRNRGRNDRLPNMESPPGSEVGAVSKGGLGGAGRGREPLCYPMWRGGSRGGRPVTASFSGPDRLASRRAHKSARAEV